MATLVRIGIFAKPLTILLPVDEEIIIGRRFFTALQHSSHIALKHAIIYCINNCKWFIKDKSEHHGVFVNRKKIPQGGICEIHDEDSIGFGVPAGTSEEEFEFTFHVNLPGKANRKGRSGPKIRSDLVLVQNKNDSSYEEMVLIHTSLNLRETDDDDDDSLSDTISNSGSCIYVSDADDDNSCITETNCVSSTSSNILTTVPNVNEIQCQDTHGNTVNGSGNFTSEEASDTNSSHLQQNERGSLTPERGENVPVVSSEVSNKNVLKETLNSEKSSEMTCSGDTNEKLNCSTIRELDTDAKQMLSESENHEKICEETDNLLNLQVSEKSAEECQNVACSNPDLSPTNKVPKKKSASKTRKRCRFTRRKKQKNKNNNPVSPRKRKQPQEDTDFEESIEKYPQIKKCYVKLQTLDEDVIKNCSFLIRESSSVCTRSGEKPESSLQNEIPCSDNQGGVELSECDSSHKIRESDKSKEQFKNSKLRKLVDHHEKSRPEKMSDDGKKPKTLYPEGKSSKLLRNYRLLLKCMNNTSAKSPKKCKKKRDKLSASDNNSPLDKRFSIVSHIEETDKQESSKETSKQVSNKEAPKSSVSGTRKLIAKSALSMMSKKIMSKSSARVTNKVTSKSLTNKEKFKRSNSVPGSILSNSGSSMLKNFVIPKKKPASDPNSCKDDAATCSSQKLDGKQGATNKKMQATYPDVRSSFSAYTIPKRKKSINDDHKEEKSLSTCGKIEHFQERSRPFKDAYGNPPNKKGDVPRRLSAEDSRNGVKRTNDNHSVSCLPNKRVALTREASLPWEVGSYQSPNSFVHTNSQYNAKFNEKGYETGPFQGSVKLENNNLINQSEGFCQSSMPREELPFTPINQVNIIANNDPVLGYSSMTSPPIHNNSMPFFTQFTDQTQSKLNILDPRRFRGERSNSFPTYDRIEPDGCQIPSDQLQDMDICDLDNSNYLIDCARANDNSKAISNSGYLQPANQNIAFSNRVTTVNPKCSEVDGILSKERVQDTIPVTSEIHEKDSAHTDFQLPIRIPSPPVLPEQTFGLTSESILQQILSWNGYWLQEQKKSTRPPPVTSSAIKKLTLSYFTFDSYALTFLPLILLETWQLIFLSWIQIRTDDTLQFIITNSNEENGSIILDCQMVTTNIEVPNFPKEGKLLSFELTSKRGKVSRVFGYILKHDIEKKASSEISEELHHCLPVAPNVSLLLVKFSLKIKKKEINLFMNKLMEARVIYYLKPQLHLIKSLLEFPRSPLIKTILVPKKSSCEMICAGEQKLNILGRYSTKQKELILSICKTISLDRLGPRIITVNGPPGTGKTHIILGVLQQLLNSGISKILVTASSDSAINEIGMRLRSICQSEGGYRGVNFILAGSLDKFPKDLLPFTIKELSKSRTVGYRQKIKICEEYEADFELEVSSFHQSINDMKERSCPPSEIKKTELELHNKLKQQIANRKELKNAQAMLREFTSNDRNGMKSQVLEEAHIVLSTLNNCRNIVEDDSLTKRLNFTCCIIDEATQSVEPEVLQPLMFGMDKVILFGDKYLPPIIHSKASLDNNYDLSLPERIHSYFVKNGESTPVITLTEQYRMDPEICLFPFTCFYSNTVTSSPHIGKSSFPIAPYIVLNSTRLSEQYKESGSPSLEEILVKLCKELLRILRQKYTIGIILPSVELKSVSKVLGRYVDTKMISVNTVDCFQSQEKDVIILPCSTSSGDNCGKGYLAHKHKLVIALTRAKRSLIIFGNLQTMALDSNIELLIDNAKERGLCHNLDSLENLPQLMLNLKTV